MLNKLSKQIHANNVTKGFFDEPKNIGEMIALIHSEASEALEADRKGNYYQGDINAVLGNEPYTGVHDHQYFVSFEECGIKNSFEDELADIIIRVLDLAAYKNIDIDKHIEAKMRYNSLRPHKHGKKY